MRRTDGVPRVVTAGHCDEGQGIGLHVLFRKQDGSNGAFIGTQQGNAWYDGTHADTLAFSVPSGHTPKGIVQIGPGSKKRFISGEWPENLQTLGTGGVCHGGYATVGNGFQRLCGSINDINVHFQDGSFDVYDQNCFNRGAWGGDSGGIVWKNYTTGANANKKAFVLGTVSLATPPNSSGNGGETCFTPIDNIRAVWGYTTVLTQP